jgi:small GTP-binding protein|tara:strand:- start:997 stop:1611 length:615 start_codon:yes stop_codon:yes gene_type:complete
MDYVIKLITLGEAGSGKTTLVSSVCNQVKTPSYQPTIGVEFSVLYFQRGGKNLKLQFWDTAGQECFAPIVKSYYKNIAGVFYVIDLTSSRSLKNIDFWLNEFKNYSNCETKMIVIGNKSDSKRRIISKEEMEEKFREKKLLYIETSAKNNVNTDIALSKMIDYIIQNFELDNHPGISGGKKKQLILKKRDTCSYMEQASCCNIS